MKSLPNAWYYGCVALGCVLALFLGSVFFGEHRISGSETELDLNSAKVRDVDYFLFIPMHVKTSTNRVSALWAEVSPPTGSRWVTAGMHSNVSKHFENHPGGAQLACVQNLDLFLGYTDLEEPKQKQLVRRFMERLASDSPEVFRAWFQREMETYR